jgi:hypothetical protein
MLHLAFLKLCWPGVTYVCVNVYIIVCRMALISDLLTKRKYPDNLFALVVPIET